MNRTHDQNRNKTSPKPGRRPLRYALTLWPEWIPLFYKRELVERGCQKDGENRVWAPPSSARGFMPGDWVALHSGAYIGGRKGKPAEAEGLELANHMMECALDDAALPSRTLGAPVEPMIASDIPTRSISCVVQIKGWHNNTPDPHPSVWRMGDDGWFWTVGEHIRLPWPIPIERGFQKLWILPTGIRDQIRAQVGDVLKTQGGKPVFSQNEIIARAYARFHGDFVSHLDITY